MLRSRSLARLAGGCLLCCSFPSLLSAEIIYQRLGNQRVAGTWAQQSDHTYQIQPAYASLDINGDGVDDLNFEHGFRRPVLYMPRDMAGALQAASDGIVEIRRTVQELRGFAVEAANAGINDEDRFAVLDAHATNALEHLSRVAHGTNFQGQRLLDGSAGKTAISSEPFAIYPLAVSDETWPGVYVATVKDAGARASLTAQAQTMSLAQDEILSINGVNVMLFAGMSQPDVVDRINEFTLLTGVVADVSAGQTRLYSADWGSAAEVWVISNVAAGPDTSGFRNTATFDGGWDATIDVDGSEYFANGRVARVDRGLARGLVLEIAEDAASSISTVAATTQATITVTDHSLDFGLLPQDSDQRLRVTLPNLAPQALGIAVPANRYPNLAAISLSSTVRANDALVLIDHAEDDLAMLQLEVDDLLQRYHEPVGQAFVTTADPLLGAQVTLAFAPLSEGQLVDDSVAFESWPVELDWRGLTDGENQAIFLGFRLSDGDASHFGWVRLDLDRQNRVTLRDLAYESAPDRGIRIAYVAEPYATAPLLIVLGSFLLRSRGRRRRG